MALLARSWNLFHGMTSPPGRRSHLEESVRLACSDNPDLLCLQEIPLWGCRDLEVWSGMTAIWQSTRRVWFPPRLGGWITRLDQGFFRSAVSGQANAILLRPRLEPLEECWTVISRGRRERRICQTVRLEAEGIGGLVIANLHASSEPGHPEVSQAEIERALAYVEAFARPDDAIVMAGDFNLPPAQLPELSGFSPPGPRIDHILVRGAEATRLEVWPESRRTTDAGALSDHAPVELTIG
jgi:endonuclease/exonuclease/phosphatase family metal-dependent hydrolase